MIDLKKIEVIVQMSGKFVMDDCQCNVCEFLLVCKMARDSLAEKWFAFLKLYRLLLWYLEVWAWMPALLMEVTVKMEGKKCKC